MLDFAVPPIEFPKPAIIRPATEELLRYGGDPMAANLPGLMPVIAASGQPASSATYVDTQTDSVDRTTYTFTANLGAGTHCVIVICGRAASAGRSIVSLTADSVAGAEASFINSGSGLSNVIGIWIVAAFGPAKTVVVQFSGAMARCGIDTYGVDRLLSATPTHANRTSSASPPSTTVNCEAGGFIIGGACNNGSSWSWTNLTERTDYDVEGSQRQSSACDNFSVTQTGLTITATPSGGSNQGMALAAFR